MKVSISTTTYSHSDRTLNSCFIVLRLYPSVPVNMRQAMKHTVLPVGGGPDASSPILVRKGEAVSYSVYAMHRRKDLYGEDADQFHPDRWNPSSGKGPDLRNIGWGYLPFNGGPRVCLGRGCTLFRTHSLPQREITNQTLMNRGICFLGSFVYHRALFASL